MTVPEVQLISGQSQGDDEEFQDWTDGRLPHCSLSFSRIDCSVSVDCEITLKGMEMRMKKRREKGILGSNTSIFAISCGSVGCSGFCVFLPGKYWTRNGCYSNLSGQGSNYYMCFSVLI